VDEDAHADELIEGPRGRRMLWELAARADESVHAVAWGVVRDLERSGGVAFGFATGWGGSPAARPADTAAGVAAHLAAAADDLVLRPGTLGAALTASVDAARPWQEPDGTDLMLADPIFDEALRTVAERVGRMPEAAWLWHPLAAPQFVTGFFYDDPETRERRVPERPEPATTGARLAGWRSRAELDEAQFARHAANYPGQPLSGAWWALPMYSGVWSTAELGAAGPAALHFLEDSMGEEHARVWPARARAGARVLEIAGPADWAELCRRHPFDVTASRRQVWGLATGRDGRWVLPDWPAVAAEWDAVHVTGAAYLRAAERAIAVEDAEAAGVEDAAATVLAGWAPGATVWLTDALEVTGAPVDWRLEDELWSPLV